MINVIKIYIIINGINIIGIYIKSPKNLSYLRRGNYNEEFIINTLKVYPTLKTIIKIENQLWI